jgi:hypothetical protein
MIREGVASKLLRAHRASLAFLGKEVDLVLDPEIE